MAITQSGYLAVETPYRAVGSWGKRPSLELGAYIYQATADGILHELRPVVHVQLLHEAGPVHLDGVDADDKLLGDLAVGVALGDELQDLPLPRAEAVIAVALFSSADAPQVVVEELAGHGRVEEGPAAGRGPASG